MLTSFSTPLTGIHYYNVANEWSVLHGSLILACFEQGGLEKQWDGLPRSLCSRGNTGLFGMCAHRSDTASWASLIARTMPEWVDQVHEWTLKICLCYKWNWYLVYHWIVVYNVTNIIRQLVYRKVIIYRIRYIYRQLNDDECGYVQYVVRP